MTSQRFSADKVDNKDLKRCFKSVILFAAIAFAVIFVSSVVPVIMQITPAHMMLVDPKEPIISYFGIEFLGLAMSPGMFICGVLMAQVLFGFLFKKNSVNVYLSFGITRSKLFLNRMLAALCSMLLAVAVPLTITLLLNIYAFGASAHVFQVFFYLVTGFFVSGAAGFAMMSFICANTGSRIESVITIVLLSSIPSRAISLAASLKGALLTGYYVGDMETMLGTSKLSFLNPMTILIDTDQTVHTLDMIFEEISPVISLSTVLCGNKVPEDLMLDMGLMLPIIVWSVLTVGMLVLGYFLLNKRKAENSNSFGKFYLSSVINGVAVAVYSISSVLGIVAMVFLTESELSRNVSPLFIILLLLIIPSAAYFLAELLIHRKMRPTLRSLPVLAGLLAVFICAFITLSTDCFGTFNKLPELSEIKSIQMDVVDPQNLFDFNAVDNMEDTYSNYKSTDEDDIKLCTKYFEKASKEARDDSFEGTLSFRLILKNGKQIVRRFNIYDDKLIYDYAKEVYGSHYFDGLMKYLMLNGIDVSQSTEYDENHMYNFYENPNSNPQGLLKGSTYYVSDSSLLFDKGIVSYIAIDTEGMIEDNDALMEALYKDMRAMSFEQMYFSNVRPVAIISSGAMLVPYENEKYKAGDFSWDGLEREYTDEFVEDGKPVKENGAYAPQTPMFFVYPGMTNTLNYLKQNGYTVGETERKIKCVYVTRDSKSASDRFTELSKQLDNIDGWFGFLEDDVPKNFGWANVIGVDASCIERYNYYAYKNEGFSDTAINILNRVFSDSGAPLVLIENPEKAKAVVEKSVPFYDSYNAEGRHVYIVYDDGAIVSEYLPEANLDVLSNKTM
ncbi:MAG: hypothetical protein IJL63_09440 [Clostridia bacterium]|nr:hypothetical protein [Clostridia bacterium]